MLWLSKISSLAREHSVSLIPGLLLNHCLILRQNLAFDLTFFRQQIIVYVYSSSSVIAKQSVSVVLASGKLPFPTIRLVLPL